MKTQELNLTKDTTTCQTASKPCPACGRKHPPVRQTTEFARANDASTRVIERMRDFKRLEKADALLDATGASVGPDLIIWRKLDDGSETWEIVPELLADNTMAAISAHEPRVTRAKLYRSLPENAPKHIRDHFELALMMSMAALAPVLIAA